MENQGEPYPESQKHESPVLNGESGGELHSWFLRNRTTAFSFCVAMQGDESDAWEMAVH